MNAVNKNLFTDGFSFDADTIDISKSSFALAKNLRGQLGYEAACKTCEQNQWNGVLAALHIMNSPK